jgi:hypothetical protein
MRLRNETSHFEIASVPVPGVRQRVRRRQPVRNSRRRYSGAFFNDYNISVPAAVSVFPEEVSQAPRSWTERAYHNLIHFNALAKGGHFAAWEQPQVFLEEVRAGFRSLRIAQAKRARFNTRRLSAIAPIPGEGGLPIHCVTSAYLL